MTDPNDIELAAMDKAASCGAEVIESFNQTDMAKWTEEQWNQFIHAVCGGYVDHIIAQQAAVHSAFGKVSAG